MVGRVERWRLVLFVVVLCAVRCASHETLCSAIKDARSCLASEKEGPRCKWCAPKKRAENNGFCIDISAPAGLCKTTETALTQLQLRKEVPGDIFEFDDVHFRSTGSHTPTHFTSESLRMTDGEINEKLFVLGLPLEPNVDNAFTLDVTNFLSHFGGNEYVLGEVTRTLQRILHKKSSLPEDDDVHKEFPDHPVPDVNTFFGAVKQQLLSHLGRMAATAIEVKVPIVGSLVGPAITAVVKGVQMLMGFAQDFFAPVHPKAVVKVNKGSMFTGAGRDFTYSDIWHAYVTLLNLIPYPDELEETLIEAKRLMEEHRDTSMDHAANEHVLGKATKAIGHAALAGMTGGVSMVATVPADLVGTSLLHHEHQQNVESRAFMMVHTLYLRERRCVEKLARAEHPSLPPPTNSDGTTLAQADVQQHGGNAPDVPSASTASDPNLGEHWALALGQVKKCDILEPNPCPFGFYCRRDQLFRRTEDEILLPDAEWNTVGYCSPVTFPQFDLGEECNLHSDCLSGICAVSPKEPKNPICLRAADVDLGNSYCEEIRKKKIVTDEQVDFLQEEVDSAHNNYNRVKAVSTYQKNFDEARIALQKARLKNRNDHHIQEGDRLKLWLESFERGIAPKLSATSGIKTYDPWFQQPPEQIQTNVEEEKIEVKSPVPRHHDEPMPQPQDITQQGSGVPLPVPDVSNTQDVERTGAHAPAPQQDLVTMLPRLMPRRQHAVGLLPGPIQSGTAERVKQQAVNVPHEATKSGKPKPMTPFEKADKAYKDLEAAKMRFSAARAELRKIRFYQCEEPPKYPNLAKGAVDKLKKEADKLKTEVAEWKHIELPDTGTGKSKDWMFPKYTTPMSRKSTVPAHKLILMNHFLGYILHVGLTQEDRRIIHWMLTQCFDPDSVLAGHGHKMQIRLAQTIATVIPCEQKYIEWLHYAGLWLRDMKDPVVNCPLLAFQLLVASGRC
eukprot:GILK01002728.1.p1 GENE.GILK01002728.1~~GILK01002728.1.p1  ORF type:complete len:955 (-),score=83.46 GILK01002728.1:170-3034(-)